MEAGRVLVAGSRSAFIVIKAEEYKQEKTSTELDTQVCRICGDGIEIIAKGDEENEIFVACDECAYPVCRPCYEYERKEGNQCCPQCKTRYKRHPGSARVEGDAEEESVDDLVKEFNLDKCNGVGNVDFKFACQLSDSDTCSEIPYTSIIEEVADSVSDSRAIITYPFIGYQGGIRSISPSEQLEDMSKLSDSKRDLILYGNGSIAFNRRVNTEKIKLKIESGDGDCLDCPMTIKARQPLSRKLSIRSSKINPYRILIVLRIVILGFYFHYRLLNPIPDAYSLWLIAVVCEMWFSVSWVMGQLPKWKPVERETYLDRLLLRHGNEENCSTLAAIDIFVTTVGPRLQPPLITANTVLSVLSVDYPANKVSCYVSDDGASMLTFEVLSQTSEFAKKWVPFCKRFNIEPRAPECYFSQKIDYLKDKVDPDFVRKRRQMKKDYEEFKVHINSLVFKAEKNPEEVWTLQDGSPWPGNDAFNHPGMIQVLIGGSNSVDEEGTRLPMLVYVSREKKTGFGHHGKAGALNALLRVSAVLSNAPYILNLDCDQYINNSKALYEAMCFLMDPISGTKIAYVQFPQRLYGINTHGGYSNHNAVFLDVDMKGLDGIQGPICVGAGCVFRRRAIYGFDAPLTKKTPSMTCNCWPTWFCFLCRRRRRNRKVSRQKDKKKKKLKTSKLFDEVHILETIQEEDQGLLNGESSTTVKNNLAKKFGYSSVFIDSTFLDSGGIVHDGNPDLCIGEALHVVSCAYENKTQWGKEVGWTYGSITEAILTGFKMHCRGWRSVYCMPKRPAFKESIFTNLTDCLHQNLQRAFGSVEIFFCSHCPIWYDYGNGLKHLQRLFYVNAVIYPWTSIFLTVYCTLPAFCLLTGNFIILEISNRGSLVYMALFFCIAITGVLEMQWGNVSMADCWKNEQFWVITSVSSNLFAFFQGILKVIAGINPNFQEKNGSKTISKWSSLFVPPLTLLAMLSVAIIIGVCEAINNGFQSGGTVLAKLVFAFLVIIHLYPVLRVLSNKSRVPTIIVVWSILIASVCSLLWLRVNPFAAKYQTPVLEVCGLDCNDIIH